MNYRKVFLEGIFFPILGHYGKIFLALGVFYSCIPISAMDEIATAHAHHPLKTATESTSVLVVGGSLVGLSSSMFLAWQGVPTMLVEQHPGSSPHPRAIGFTPRTMELFRAVGLGSSIPQVPTGFRLRRVQVESLAGRWNEESQWTPKNIQASAQEALPKELSPCNGAAIAQDRLEPILREKAIELGADIRLNTELLNFTQDDDGVTASLRERSSGREYTVRAAYMVAADGHRSPVREALGIGRCGVGHLRTVRSVLFQASLEEYLQKGIRQFDIKQSDFEAFLTTYGDGRWVLFFSDDKERDEGDMKLMIYKAIGRPDLPVEIVTTGCWELSALIADKFMSGRVFLAGDAAHTLPPNRGGYGANTGIEDAHNLAWKIFAVLSGTSMPQLLNSYDAERRPIAHLRLEQIFARPDYKKYAPMRESAPIIDDDAMELGQLYRSPVVLGAGNELPPALRPEQWAGQPGTRAPHIWMSEGDTKLSTLDWFQRTWIVVSENELWRSIVAQVNEKLGVKLAYLHIGAEVKPLDPSAFREAFGLGSEGASLVRPDGYIAWRSVDFPANPLYSLTDAFGQVSFAKGASLEILNSVIS